MDKESIKGLSFSISKGIKNDISEHWKTIKNYSCYEISDKGRVISNVGNYPRLLKLHDNGKGYYFVDLWNENGHKQFTIHRLVAEHFIDKVEGKDFVDHIDGNSKNNIYTNLRWVTKKENTNNENTRQHVIDALNKNREILNIKIAKCNSKGEVIEIYESIREAARRNKCDQSKITAIVNHKHKYDSKGYKYYPKTCGGYYWKKVL